jgi:hypothetical protein
MSYDVRDDLLDLRIQFPRDYDPRTVSDDEPECANSCHDPRCCLRYIDCECGAK